MVTEVEPIRQGWKDFLGTKFDVDESHFMTLTFRNPNQGWTPITKVDEQDSLFTNVNMGEWSKIGKQYSGKAAGLFHSWVTRGQVGLHDQSYQDKTDCFLVEEYGKLNDRVHLHGLYKGPQDLLDDGLVSWFNKYGFFKNEKLKTAEGIDYVIKYVLKDSEARWWN